MSGVTPGAQAAHDERMRKMLEEDLTGTPIAKEPTPQPFRAGDVVEVLSGSTAGERWVIAVYDARRDEAWIAGWPETLVSNASKALRLDRAADDDAHARMISAIDASSGAKVAALKAVRERGGTP